MRSKHLQKLLVMLFCTAFFSAPAVVTAQQSATISLSIPQALKKITKTFGTEFIYDGELLRDIKTSYDLDNIRNKSLEEVLKGVLYPNGFLFVYLKENYYTIVPKDRVGEAYAKSMNSANTANISNTNTTANQAPQSRNISGTVVNSSGSPLDGVSITAKNAGTGTTTNPNGYFTILVNDNDVLVISSIGYIQQEIKIDNQDNIKITLEGQQKILDEVVVVGYGTQKRSDITGSVTSVPKDRLSNLPVTNILQAIEGSVAGLNITTNSLSPGSSAEILVRGQNSFSAGTGPFIVVDGIPISTLGGVTNDINPNDIASIEVLKDASAVAIYGTRGSNGVILITTKRGATGKAKISYNAFAGPEFKTNLLPFMDGPQYVEKNLEYARQTGRNPVPVPNFGEQANYDAGRTFDWIEAISQNGFIQDHNLSISGGTADIKYYISGEYLKQQGVLQGYQYGRTSLRSNLDANLTGWLKVGVSYYFVANNYDGGKVDFLKAGKMSPYSQPRDSAGNYIFFPMFPDTFYENPFLGLNNKVIDRNKNMTGNFYGEVKLPVKGLKYRLNGSYSYLTSRNNFYSGRSANNSIGTATANNGETNSWIIENILSYDRTWANHHVDVTGLYSAQQSSRFNSGIAANTFINDQLTFNNIEAAAIQKASSGSSEAKFLSQMLRINYSFGGKYLFTATARRDGYSAFGANTSKNATFPSVAVGWNISNEEFMNRSLINNLKLRASYGSSGNQAIDPYRTITQQGAIQYIYNTTTTSGVIANVLGNPNLKWESTIGTNLGLDFSILKSRISGTVDVYKTKTSDVIITRQIPVISGYSAILDNVGKTSNRGIEIMLNTVNIKNKNFTWQTSLNAAVNRNKVVEIYGNNKDDRGNNLFIGKSLGAVYDYKLIGVWQTGEDASKTDPAAKPGDLKFEDTNGDGKITTDDRIYLGTRFPKYVGGISNTFYYKQFSLNIFMQGVFGVFKNNPALDIQNYAGRQNIFADIGYWTDANKSNSRPSLAYTNSRGYNYPTVSNYFRVKDITLSYRLNNSMLDRLNLGSAMFYISGRNIHTFTNWFGYDPESNANYPNESSQRFLNYPNVSTYVFGVNLSLR